MFSFSRNGIIRPYYFNFDYHIPTKILFGKSKLDELATVGLPGKKALIVITGGTAMTKFGYLERVQNLLNRNNVNSVVFNKILPNPIKKHVMEGAEMARAENCDFIIGLAVAAPLIRQSRLL